MKIDRPGIIYLYYSIIFQLFEFFQLFLTIVCCHAEFLALPLFPNLRRQIESFAFSFLLE